MTLYDAEIARKEDSNYICHIVCYNLILNSMTSQICLPWTIPFNIIEIPKIKSTMVPGPKMN